MWRLCRWVDDETRAEIAALGAEDSEVTFTVWPAAQMRLTRQQARPSRAAAPDVVNNSAPDRQCCCATRSVTSARALCHSLPMAASLWLWLLGVLLKWFLLD